MPSTLSLAQTWPWWLGFHVVVLVMLAIDLGAHHDEEGGMSKKAALGWSVLWIACSLVFCAVVWAFFGADAGATWLSAYLLEKSLSVDNLFVILLIFGFFKVAPGLQHRVLYWGILGAIVLRASLILGGVALVQRFEFVLVIFGVILLYSAYKVTFSGDDDEEDLENNKIVRAFRRLVPMTDDYRGGHFTVVEDGKRLATPLLLVLVTVELSDVIFALDSIPAVFGVSQDAFIIYTSNIFAILGLRALFFLLQASLNDLRFIGPAVGIVLAFVGVKMIASHFGVHVQTWVSLVVIACVLTLGVVASLIFPKAESQAEEDKARPN